MSIAFCVPSALQGRMEKGCNDTGSARLELSCHGWTLSSWRHQDLGPGDPGGQQSCCQWEPCPMLGGLLCHLPGTSSGSTAPGLFARQNWAIHGNVTQTHWGEQSPSMGGRRPALSAMRCRPACDLEPSQAAVSHRRWPCSHSHTVLSLPAAANWL